MSTRWPSSAWPATSGRWASSTRSGHGLLSIAAVAAIVYLFVRNVSPKPPYPSDLAIWISIGWLVVGIIAMAGLVIFKPGRAEAAVIIGEGDTPEEAGLLDG